MLSSADIQSEPFMDKQLPVRMNTCVPVDAHNFITKHICDCQTLWLIDWHFVIQPKTPIPSHNLWMTGIRSLESESIVTEGPLIDMVS